MSKYAAYGCFLLTVVLFATYYAASRGALARNRVAAIAGYGAIQRLAFHDGGLSAAFSGCGQHDGGAIQVVGKIQAGMAR